MCHGIADFLQRRFRFVAFHRDGKLQYKTGVVFTKELVLSDFYLGVCIRQRSLQITGKSDISLFLLVVNKQEHINKRYLVVADTVNQSTVIIVVQSICGVQGIGNFHIHIQHFRKLSRRKLLRQGIAVHGFDVGKSLTGFDIRKPRQGI